MANLGELHAIHCVTVKPKGVTFAVVQLLQFAPFKKNPADVEHAQPIILRVNTFLFKVWPIGQVVAVTEVIPRTVLRTQPCPSSIYLEWHWVVEHIAASALGQITQTPKLFLKCPYLH